MLANPSKFQAIIMSKSKEPVQTSLNIDGKIVETKQQVEILGVEIDDNLKFSPHINSICSKAGGQLNSLFRFNKYLSPYTKKLSVNSYILSNFGYCPLVWHFCSAKSKNKIEQIQKRAFKFLSLNNDTPTNAESTMETKRLRSLGIEIFKTLNNINAGYMKEIFNKPRNRCSQRLNNLENKKYNGVRYGRNSLRVLGPILWNSLPPGVRKLSSLKFF